MSDIKKVFSDAKTLTDDERRKLCEMIYRALLEIRILGWNGKAKQAAELADAFHNVPNMMWNEVFSLDFFRNFLEDYQQQFPDSEGVNYPKMFDKLFSEENQK